MRNGTRNQIPVQPRKGAKKLVSNNFAKMLNKKVATKVRETCEKHSLLPLVQKKLLTLLFLFKQ
jgi:hypothetical protein